MDQIESIVTAHLDAWNMAAGPQRAEAVAAVYAGDVFVGEPGAALRGHEGVAQAIDALQSQLPDTAISRSGPIQVAQDLVTYAWSLGPAGGPALATGRDVLLVRDDQVASLYVVIDAP
ncbi:nuclear transport factor 2 family protein [Aeromicrobium sp. Sec7.5]|uniref:nuclear transport factor 2 family protein n=1 Tax=Aeromicrobium sp. Sec7.5 TaxID=3121276 RepID=UPI002FE442BF